MKYQVLARKWRPQIFSDVVGQQHVLTALANALSLGRIHHAYLLSGSHGVGKTTIARLFAKALNCETGITSTPCGKCKICCEIKQGNFIDLIEIDAASRTKVEDTRELLSDVQYTPAHGRFKIYLIDEVHMLSRYSFNALLKTLEEPPAHVKFLLATTDPQKLPLTVLSRCLQFHLQAIEANQIRDKLANILQKENIHTEPYALKLLACAASGSMRDALSLTDHAIAIGGGRVSSETVNLMLGISNTNQPLKLIEALINADGKGMMTYLAQYASHGMGWERLLIEMLSLMHRIALIQLLPDHFNDDDDQNLLTRLHELARSIPPSELQLHYQILLVGRKELPYAPNHRMGVEMTLLRALAFHSSEMPPPLPPSAGGVKDKFAYSTEKSSSISSEGEGLIPVSGVSTLSNSTNQLLQVRTALLRCNEIQKKKEDNLIPLPRKIKSNVLKHLTLINDCTHQKEKSSHSSSFAKIAFEGFCHCKDNQKLEQEKGSQLRKDYHFPPKLMEKLTEESLHRDPWSAQVYRLSVPKLAQQLAFNTWRENVGPNNNRVCLHLRSSQRHLNSMMARKSLQDALSTDLGTSIELSILEDDNPGIKTPLEWQQAIYKEKLIHAREIITTDTHIQILRRFFDAELDEDSIQPV